MKQLQRGYEFDRTVAYYDDNGDVAEVEGDPSWSSDDVAIVNVISPPTNPASDRVGDPFSCTIQAVGPVGSSTMISASADADLGEGVVPVVVTDEISVVSGQATSGKFDDSEPRPIESQA